MGTVNYGIPIVIIQFGGTYTLHKNLIMRLNLGERRRNSRCLSGLIMEKTGWCFVATHRPWSFLQR